MDTSHSLAPIYHEPRTEYDPALIGKGGEVMSKGFLKSAGLAAVLVATSVVATSTSVQGQDGTPDSQRLQVCYEFDASGAAESFRFGLLPADEFENGNKGNIKPNTLPLPFPSGQYATEADLISENSVGMPVYWSSEYTASRRGHLDEPR